MPKKRIGRLMTSKELLQLNLKRDAFIEQYVAARIRWISKSVKPTLGLREQEDFVTLYETVDTRSMQVDS
jgi:hypothetical protein